eukprot:SAG11_NODE_1900_length_4091_cov_2.418838_1_plen_66_part_00
MQPDSTSTGTQYSTKFSTGAVAHDRNYDSYQNYGPKDTESGTDEIFQHVHGQLYHDALRPGHLTN